MHFDFAAFLVLLTVLTGGIWAVDAAAFAPRRRRRHDDAQRREAGESNRPQNAERPRQPVVVEYARSFFPVILAVLVIRSFIVEPFRIPSSSMMPTLLVGDFILVNKFAYGLRLPVTHNEVIELGNPERGDVVVFRFPEDPSVDYIKRVVGLPGDRITYRNKTIYVNGEPVPQEPLGRYTGIGRSSTMTGAILKSEELGAHTHRLLLRPNQPARPERTWVVPEDRFFVMGDNRDKSNDSRFWASTSTVPERNLVGKAFLIWMHWDASSGGIGWGRIGNVIH